MTRKVTIAVLYEYDALETRRKGEKEQIEWISKEKREKNENECKFKVLPT